MSDQDRTSQPPVASNRAKQQAVDRLRTHYVRDDIDVEKYEAMVDIAWSAKVPADLEQLLSRLPELPDAEHAAMVPMSAPASAPRAASAGAVREHGFQIAILSGSDRTGSWVPPQKLSTIAVMGGVGLDFREAKFGPGVTEVTILVVCGGVDVIVPPGLTVETAGFGLLGGFDSYSQTIESDDPSAPVLRIRGLALMGGVEVKMMLPGETGRDAKRRRRELRKHQRMKRLGK